MGVLVHVLAMGNAGFIPSTIRFDPGVSRSSVLESWAADPILRA